MLKLIAQTLGNSTEIPLTALGATGAVGSLIIAPQYKDSRFEGKDRMGDRSSREFIISATIVRATLGYGIKGDLTPEDGGAYLSIPHGKSYIIVDANGLHIRLDANSKGEISLASGPFTTSVNWTPISGF